VVVASCMYKHRWETRELKTTRGHVMPSQQHVYNGLAQPAVYFIFARERTGVHIGTGNEVAVRTVWASRRWHGTDIGTDKVKAQSITHAIYIHIRFFITKLSHCHWKLRRVTVTLGRSILNSCRQHLIISLLFILNNFIKSLFITKSIDDICDWFNRQASRP